MTKSEENVTVHEFYNIPHWKSLSIKFDQYSTGNVPFWHVVSYLFIFIWIFEKSYDANYIKLQTELPQGHHFSQSWFDIWISYTMCHFHLKQCIEALLNSVIIKSSKVKFWYELRTNFALFRDMAFSAAKILWLRCFYFLCITALVHSYRKIWKLKL